MKRVSIVFQETGQQGGKGFNVFIEGVDTGQLSKVPMDKWGPADYWGMKCFSIVVDLLKQSGVVKTETPMHKGPTQ